MTKEDIRKQVFKFRAELAPDTAREKSLAIFQSLLRIPEFLAARNVALYLGRSGEVLTDELLSYCRAHTQKVAVPYYQSGHWGFAWMESEDIQPGPLNTRQPGNILPAKVEEMDILIIPCVGVDATCGRVGHGKGIYDRLLRNSRGMTVGLAFEFQVFDQIPMEKHDHRLDVVITEKRTFRHLPHFAQKG